MARHNASSKKRPDNMHREPSIGPGTQNTLHMLTGCQKPVGITDSFLSTAFQFSFSISLVFSVSLQAKNDLENSHCKDKGAVCLDRV